ncbi:hypothetical protein ACNOYE_36855 [Nannocystaceae bacterium ST9]
MKRLLGWLVAAITVLVVPAVQAAPPSVGHKVADSSKPVIPPGREAQASALLRDARPAAGLRFGGPSIDADTVSFALLGSDDARLATLRLEPVHRAEPGESTSTSFVIRSELAEGVELAKGIEEAGVEESLRSASASVQARDQGDFYVIAQQAEPRHGKPTEPESPAIEPDRPGNRRRWAWQTGLTLAILALAGGALLRPRRTARLGSP